MIEKKDKRKYPRFDVVAKIGIKKIKDLEDIKGAFVKDISAEGFCFCSNQEIKPGEILEIEIVEQQIEEQPICIRGQVVWCDRASSPNDGQSKDLFLTGVKILGVRKNDEARFAMLYCERVIEELKKSLLK